MPDEQVVQTAKEKLQVIESMLDEYGKKVGLSSLTFNKEVEEILSMTSTDIQQLTAEQCGEKSWVLFGYSAFIQKQSNRQSVRLTWANRHLDYEIGKKITNYGNQYTKYEERRQLVLSDDSDSYIQALSNLAFHAKIRLEELSFLSSKLTMLAECLITQQRNKDNSRRNKV